MHGTLPRSPSGPESHRWCHKQVKQNQRCKKIHSSMSHRPQTEPEGELEEILP